MRDRRRACLKVSHGGVSRQGRERAAGLRETPFDFAGQAFPPVAKRLRSGMIPRGRTESEIQSLAHLDISAFAPRMHVDEREGRSLAGFARLDGHEVLVILGAYFQFSHGA